MKELITNKINEIEDWGWYSYEDKQTCIEILYELAEELNNRSCEGCKYNTYEFENTECIYCSRRCGDFYEAKGDK